MTLSLIQIKTISEISSLIYSFLPGKPHPYADFSISYKGIAHDLGLYNYWKDISKESAINNLLNKTYENKRGEFCNLILEVVKRGIYYKTKKDKPILREEIEELNKLILKLEFKIPQLWDQEFLNSLPKSRINKNGNLKAEVYNNLNLEKYLGLKKSLIKFTELNPQERGYAFEEFLNEFFNISGMDPNRPFKIIGEQIDGSFQLDGNFYLLEAKWTNNPIQESDLLVFRGKIEGKAIWARGLFVSYNSFTAEALEAFSKGKATNIIGMNSQDLFFILDRKIDLKKAIRYKVRKAAETGDFFHSMFNYIE